MLPRVTAAESLQRHGASISHGAVLLVWTTRYRTTASTISLDAFFSSYISEEEKEEEEEGRDRRAGIFWRLSGSVSRRVVAKPGNSIDLLPLFIGFSSTMNNTGHNDRIPSFFLLLALERNITGVSYPTFARIRPRVNSHFAAVNQGC